MKTYKGVHNGKEIYSDTQGPRILLDQPPIPIMITMSISIRLFTNSWINPANR